MTRIKVNELSGAALDWAVAKCEDPEMANAMADCGSIFEGYHYSTDWSQGGPLIERVLDSLHGPSEVEPKWVAFGKYKLNGQQAMSYGPTPLIATMRCYVVSKLGDEIDVPEELL